MVDHVLADLVVDAIDAAATRGRCNSPLLPIGPTRIGNPATGPDHLSGSKTCHLSWAGLLCGSFILSDQPAEDGPAFDPLVGQVNDGWMVGAQLALPEPTADRSEPRHQLSIALRVRPRPRENNSTISEPQTRLTVALAVGKGRGRLDQRRHRLVLARSCRRSRRSPSSGSRRGDRARDALVSAVQPVYLDVEELLVERGIEVDHVTVSRWV